MIIQHLTQIKILEVTFFYEKLELLDFILTRECIMRMILIRINKLI